MSTELAMNRIRTLSNLISNYVDAPRNLPSLIACVGYENTVCYLNDVNISVVTNEDRTMSLYIDAPQGSPYFWGRKKLRLVVDHITFTALHTPETF